MKSFLLMFCVASVAVAAPPSFGYLPANNQASRFIYRSNEFQATPTAPLAYSGFGASHQKLQQPQLQQQPPPPPSQQAQQQNHYHQQQHQAPIITKNFYIHSAPEESEIDIQQDLDTFRPKRRHFNVVFIKAPTQSIRTTSLSLAKSLDEEKTVIYVLSKKPDITEIHSALQDNTHHNNKPEVFFIKYKTPEEALHAQNQIQAQYDALGGSSQVSDEGFAPSTSVVGALRTDDINSQSGTSSSGTSSVLSGNQNGLLGGAQTTNAYLPPRKS